jgi:hypothetical protein
MRVHVAEHETTDMSHGTAQWRCSQAALLPTFGSMKWQRLGKLLYYWVSKIREYILDTAED